MDEKVVPPPAGEVKIRKTRASKPKVKTGCQTCKYIPRPLGPIKLPSRAHFLFYYRSKSNANRWISALQNSPGQV